MADCMKIFVLTSRFPYPIEKGDKLRIYYQIKELSKRHEVILCALSERKVDEDTFKKVEQYCSKVYYFPMVKWKIMLYLMWTVLGSWPLQVGYFFRWGIERRIHKILKEEAPDHVYVQLVRMAAYGRKIDIPSTLDYMDAFSIGMSRRAQHMAWPFSLVFKRESRTLQKFERQVFSYFQHHTIISEQDRNYLNVPKPEEISVVPNGVDTQFFIPNKDKQPDYELVFVGNMSYFPNVIASKFLVRKVMPRVWAKFPDVKVLLAGANPSLEVKALSSKRVHVSGWLDDVRDAYWNADIFVAPLFSGSGQQNKILEAMAVELPVITTPLVNRGIGAESGELVLLGETAEAIADHIIYLINHPDVRSKMGAGGREFVENSFSWPAAVAALEAIWEKDSLSNTS